MTSDTPGTMCAAFRRTVAAERIRAYEIISGRWQPGGDLVTPTMKVRRRAVPDAYGPRVDALYATS
jgi:long-chain acyl-CoA synthetase